MRTDFKGMTSVVPFSLAKSLPQVIQEIGVSRNGTLANIHVRSSRSFIRLGA